MILLLQRVSHARVTVDGAAVGECGPGYLLFLCVLSGDTEEQARQLAQKVVSLRLFDGADGKINDRSLLDVGGEACVVSQFTLAGRTEKGNRPDYTAAADRGTAETLYVRFQELLREAGVRQVAAGTFGAHMAVELVNDGPVTLVLER